jgi:hypothetical protein
MQLDTLPSRNSWKRWMGLAGNHFDAPCFYKGGFKGPRTMHDNPMTLDIFITIINGVKVIVRVNGHNLGQCRFVGPQ